MLMKVGRVGTLIFWAIVIAAVAGVLPGGLNQLMRNLGILILLAHFAEVGLMYTTLRERLKPTLKDAALVMLYGAFYLKPKLDASR
jgi:uncharacterized protein YhhL (DUF1145 family)